MEKPRRRIARENAFIRLFADSFSGADSPQNEPVDEMDEAYALDPYTAQLFAACEAHLPEIDGIIAKYLKGWTPNRLPKVNLAILRLAVTEMRFGGEENMDSVAINEAVELAKKYGDEGDYQFINGILGSIAKEKNEPSHLGETKAESQ